MSVPSRLVCQGCGFEIPTDEPYPFRCPNAKESDDTDHLLRRVLAPAGIGSPAENRQLFLGQDPNPFIRYRPLLHSYQIASRSGFEDAAFCVLVEELDRAIARVDGKGFTTTPFLSADLLAEAADLRSGTLWIKDETDNVSGSHKARHLLGLQLWLEIAERFLDRDRGIERRLAIASCGNAALAAAVVARAANRTLEVFVPPWADPAVITQLRELDARLVSCPREGSIPGDPCFHRFREAVRRGALPFTCQGTENGLVIEGGKTLVWEMLSALLAADRQLDYLFIQVGGGALASACIQGLQDARDLGLLERLPVVHTVQTVGASPLHRAWDSVVDRILIRHQRDTGQSAPYLGTDIDRARFVRDRVSPALVREELHYAAVHRSDFMWPWEEEPKSIATGILDDETYDWFVLVEGMLTTGGAPLIVSEEILAEANSLARDHTGIPADPTGTAGFAGLLHLQRQEPLAAGETSAVLFTGVER